MDFEETDPATGYISFRFTSKEYDEESGLYYYGARYYEPRLSRWMSADPAGWELINPMGEDGEPVPDGWPEGFGPGPRVGMRLGYSVIEAANWYAYAGNNPVKYVDPTGMEAHIFSIPVIGKHRHLFIAVKDTEGRVQVRSLYPKSKFVGIVTVSDFVEGKSIPSVHDGTTKESTKELEKAESYFADGSLNGGLLHEGLIAVPEGMTEEEFNQAVLDTADNYPVEDRPYDSKGGYIVIRSWTMLLKVLEEQCRM